MNDKIKAIEERHSRDAKAIKECPEQEVYVWAYLSHEDRATLIEEYHLLEGRLEAAEQTRLGLLKRLAVLDAKDRAAEQTIEKIEESIRGVPEDFMDGAVVDIQESILNRSKS